MNARVPFPLALPTRHETGFALRFSRPDALVSDGPTLVENSGHSSSHGQRGTCFAQGPVAAGSRAGLTGKSAPVGAAEKAAGMSVSGFRRAAWRLAHEEAFSEAMTNVEVQAGTRLGRATEAYCDAVH